MIGRRLLRMRKEKKMNQQELAEILSLSKYSISLYENDKSVPSEETLISIAKTFDVSVDYLLGLIDEPYSYKRDAETILRMPLILPPEVKEVVDGFVEFLHYKYSVEE